MTRIISAAVLVVALLSFARNPALADPALDYKIYCMRCHGDGGAGDGPDGASLSTKPKNFADCAVMSKLTDETIFNAIKNGGATVGASADMPAWGQAFSDDQIKALAAFVRNFCHK